MGPIQTLENLISTDRLPEALDFIEALPQEERQRWQVQNLTGVVCLCCGQPKEARTFFEAALEQQPDDAEVLYNLAETYASLGMKRRAEEMLERCRRCAGYRLPAAAAGGAEGRTVADGGLLFPTSVRFRGVPLHQVCQIPAAV